MTQTLTNERLREIAERRSPSLRWGEAEQIAAELLANREAQPAASELGEICVGRLPTMNQEEYPGLGDYWVQLRIGASRDEILARVYGATPDEAVARARALTAPPAPAALNDLATAVNRLLDCDGTRGHFSAIRCSGAREEVERLLAQPVSSGCTATEGGNG